ncbi:MAG TPA: hypothetical protein VL049_15000 [Candidatus Dormibacteraeota bacterium]|nr:hypothetical protein [Candidatus Dormibacteraeota bacterium]
MRQRTRAAVVACGAALLIGAAPPTRTPGPTAALPPGIWPRLGSSYTLLDPSLALPPLEVMAPDLSLMARELGDEATPTLRPEAEVESSVKWKLGYRHAQLNDLYSEELRNDPSTGFTRRVDTDVLALGMSWSLAGSQVGLAYQLQSARGGIGGDTGLSRFLPGSEAATHSLTLGVTREFDAGLPPPAPPPLLVLDEAPAEDSRTEATPSPAP